MATKYRVCLGGYVRRSWKLMLALPLVALAIPAAFVGAYELDRCWNRGSEFGYYGEFNHVRKALVTIPGVRITNEWQNQDISLEEFGFDLMVDGRPVRLYVAENEAVRRMSRDSAVVDLKAWIAEELSRSPTVK
jgi:hypothetical protein